MTVGCESLRYRTLQPSFFDNMLFIITVYTAVHLEQVLTVHNSIYLNSQIQFAFW